MNYDQFAVSIGTLKLVSGSDVKRMMDIVTSPAMAIAVTVLLGIYLVYLAKNIIAPETHPNSTVARLPRIAWAVPLALVSAVIVKVVTVFR